MRPLGRSRTGAQSLGLVIMMIALLTEPSLSAVASATLGKGKELKGVHRHVGKGASKKSIDDFFANIDNWKILRSQEGDHNPNLASKTNAGNEAKKEIAAAATVGSDAEPQEDGDQVESEGEDDQETSRDEPAGDKEDLQDSKGTEEEKQKKSNEAKNDKQKQRKHNDAKDEESTGQKDSDESGDDEQAELDREWEKYEKDVIQFGIFAYVRIFLLFLIALIVVVLSILLMGYMQIYVGNFDERFERSRKTQELMRFCHTSVDKTFCTHGRTTWFLMLTILSFIIFFLMCTTSTLLSEQSSVSNLQHSFRVPFLSSSSFPTMLLIGLASITIFAWVLMQLVVLPKRFELIFTDSWKYKDIPSNLRKAVMTMDTMGPDPKPVAEDHSYVVDSTTNSTSETEPYATDADAMDADALDANTTDADTPEDEGQS